MFANEIVIHSSSMPNCPSVCVAFNDHIIWKPRQHEIGAVIQLANGKKTGCNLPFFDEWQDNKMVGLPVLQV
jgi:hypothetical protein